MALGREVHHRVRLVRREDPVERRPVADVGLLEGVAVARRDAVEVGEVRRVGQRVEVDHLVPVGDRLPHHRRADEARAARHQKPHASTPYSKGDVQSRKAGARRSLSERVTPPRLDAPVDAEVGIVPEHAAVAGGVVDVVDLVDDQRVVGQRDEAVQEAARHQDLRAVRRRDLLGDPARRRSASRAARRPPRRGSRPAPPAPAWSARRAAPGSAARAACPARADRLSLSCTKAKSSPARPCAARSRSRRSSRARRRSGAASGPSRRAARSLGFPCASA